MGGWVEKGVDVVKEAPKTAAKAAVDLGKSAIGANGGNYFEELGKSAVNSAVVSTTLGMTGTKDLGGTNTLDKQLGIVDDKGLIAPTAAPEAEVVEDPYLKAELENSKKKGRASTIFGGSSDTVGSKSARRTLLESI